MKSQLCFDFTVPAAQPAKTAPPSLAKLSPAQRKIADAILARRRRVTLRRAIILKPVRQTFTDELKEIVISFLSGNIPREELARHIAERFETSIEYAQRTYADPILQRYAPL